MKEMSAMTCLLDKLIDEKMYDQVVELYEKKFINMRKIPNSFLTAVTYSLFKKVTLFIFNINIFIIIFKL